MADENQYVIEIIRAPKGTKKQINIMIFGYSGSPPKIDGNRFTLSISNDNAKKMYKQIRDVWNASQVSFTPRPPGMTGGAATSHVDVVTQERVSSARPVDPNFDAGRISDIEDPVDDSAVEDLEGSDVDTHWPYAVTRPADLQKLEQKAGEKKKLQAGKQRIRLGVHGERVYLIEPIRDENASDRGQWRAQVCYSDETRVRLGSSPDWMGAIAFIHVFETKLVPHNDLAAPEPEPPPISIPIGAPEPAGGFKGFISALNQKIDANAAAREASSGRGPTLVVADEHGTPLRQAPDE